MGTQLSDRREQEIRFQRDRLRRAEGKAPAVRPIGNPRPLPGLCPNCWARLFWRLQWIEWETMRPHVCAQVTP